MLLDQLLLSLFFFLLRDLKRKGGLERCSCCVEFLSALADVVVVIVVKLYELVQGLSLLLASQLLLVEQGLDLAETWAV